MERPNILFIMTDQQRYDGLSCRGDTPARTPNLDRLAAQGTRFDNCHVQCPLCVPSRLSMLTGTYVHTHKTFINEHPLDETLPTWAERLGDAGYRAVAVGKTHSVHRGFERVPMNFRGHAAEAKWPHGRFVRPADCAKGDWLDFRIARQGVEFLRELGRGPDPFCLFVGIHAPHPPYFLPEPFDTLYDPAEVPVPEFHEEELAGKTYGQREMYERFFKPLDPDHIRRMIAGYWASVAIADAAAGAVLDALDDFRLAEDTLVCFVSDHGDLNGEHGLFSKFTSAYDSETRVPLIWRWPGHIPEGRVVDDLVESIDLVPTLLEVADAEPIPEDNGRSLWPFLEGGQPQATHREYVTSTCGWSEISIRPQGHMIRTPTHKLVYYPLEPVDELYDVVNDPGEVNNLHGDPEHVELHQELKDELMRFLTTSARLPQEDHPRFTRKPM